MKKLFAIIALIFSSLLATSTVASAAPTNYLTGQILCRGSSCYMVQKRDNTNTVQRYFGSVEYLNEWKRVTGQKGGQFDSQTPLQTWNWSMELPCGQIARDTSNNRLFMVENVADHNAPWITDGIFIYSDADEIWLANLNDPTLQYIVTRPGAIKQYSRLTSSAEQDAYGGPQTGGGGAQVSAQSLPTCLIVNQTGTDQFYRITGHYDFNSVGERVSKKSYIGNNELLNLWLNRNGSFISADLTALSSDPPAGIPPGMLVRSISNPQIYFINDQAEKWAIATKADFDKLGFTVNDVTYLSDATINSMPSAGTWAP